MLNNLVYMSGVDNSKVKEDKFADEEYFAHWADDAIYKVSAVDSGGTPVMTGTGNNKFSPWMNYTREQAVATMYRLYNCEAAPVLIPQNDENIYFRFRNDNKITKFDTVNHTEETVITFPENTYFYIVTVSGNEIYYIISDGFYKTGTSREVLYKVNTDGTGNTALTPESVKVYLSHRYIYYSPADARSTVIRTNLDGTGEVKADFSSMCYHDDGWCGVWTDINGIAYIDVNASCFPESYYLAKKIYAYDFSTGTMEEVPKENMTKWMRSSSVTDGEYVYYIYEKVFDAVRFNAQYELHRCKTDGTEDIILYDDLAEDRWSFETNGALRLYKNNLYVPIYQGFGDTYVILKFDEKGNTSVIHFRALDKFQCCLIGIVNDRLYYRYIDDSREIAYGSAKLDGKDSMRY